MSIRKGVRILKKILIFIIAFLVLQCGSALAASFDSVTRLSPEDSKTFVIGLAGRPVWLDKNGNVINSKATTGMSNLEHFTIGIVDVDHLAIELIRDSGEHITWYWGSVSSDIQYHMQPNIVDFAQELQWVFYLDNPYEAHSDWDDNTWDMIRNQQIGIGMTRTMVRMSWGSPDKSNHFETAYSSQYQWIYKNKMIYFDNGALSAIQDY